MIIKAFTIAGNRLRVVGMVPHEYLLAVMTVSELSEAGVDCEIIDNRELPDEESLVCLL